VTLRYRIAEIANAGAKGCRLAAVVDAQKAADAASVRLPSASSEWKEFKVTVSQYNVIQFLYIAMDCPDGGTGTIHVDDINAVPAGLPEGPDTTDYGVAQNPSFEDNKEKWTFDANADIVIDANPGAFKGEKFAKLFGQGGSIEQDIELPAGATVAGYNSFDVKFKFRVAAYNQGSAPGTAACSLTVQYNDEKGTALQSIVGQVSEWRTFGIRATDPKHFIKKIKILTDCSQYAGASAEVHIDAVEILTNDYKPPMADDVCINGGFEQGQDPWKFGNEATIGTADSFYDAQYALLKGESRGAIGQTIQLPDGAPKGYNQYVVKFKYKVASFDGQSGGCQLVANFDTFPVAEVDKRRFASAGVWTDYQATFTNDDDFVKFIIIGTACDPGPTTKVYIDQVKVSCLPSLRHFAPDAGPLASSLCRRRTRRCQSPSRPTSPGTAGLRAARSSGPSQARATSARSTQTMASNTPVSRAASQLASASRCPAGHFTTDTTSTWFPSSGA
jgi:hypothetical protein